MKRKDIQKCSEINDPLDTYIWEPISFPFAKFFAKRHWSPNVATIISLICGVAGGVLFAFHNIWLNVAGAVLFLLGIIFDDADGQIARINHCGSLYGRFFDGFCDGLVYLAAYLGITIHAMSQFIPFTDIQWSWYIFLIAIPVGAYFHGKQARIADYQKQLYMYLTGYHSELSNSEKLEKQFENEKMSFLNKVFYLSYLSYTKTQEKENKRSQLLLKKIEENNGVIPEGVSKEFKKHVWLFKLGNLETVGLRTLMLIALLLAGVVAWHFAFILLVLEPISIFLQVRVEKISAKCAKEYF